MAAYNIPLAASQPTPIESPAQVMGQVQTIKDLQQRADLQRQETQLRQQQTEASQLANQETAMQIATTKALNMAYQKNVKQNPDGSYTFDHQGAAATMAGMGFGSAVPGIQANSLKVAEGQVKLLGSQLDAHGKELSQISQTLQNVNDDTAWQAVKPRVQQMVKAYGVDLPVPDKYDPAAVGILRSAGMKASEFNSWQKDTAQMAQWLYQDLTNGVPKFEQEYRNDLSNTTGDKDLNQVNQKYQAIISNMPANMQPAYKAVLNAGPTTWTQDTPTRAFAQSMTPGQKIQKQEAEARLAETAATHRETSEDRATRQAEQARHDREVERLTQEARDTQQQRADQMNNRTASGGRPLTPGQVKVEERNISAQEYGTATRPGLHSQRVQLGDQIRRGLDAKGQPLDDAGRQAAEDKLQSLTDTLQNTQYRKADLYNIPKPHPDDVRAAKDGDEIDAGDGTLWKKQDGVVYFQGRGGASAPPAPSAPAAAPAPAPAPASRPATTPAAKPFPRAKLGAFAQANRISPAEAETRLKAQGYSLQW